ncbi:hypothetical protein [Mycobacterium simiae]|uniref:hypothetical protein n=1 Tax=Mycobacterium simiae TaxID=1784 RepID=UPI0013D25C18|nr:hypothetical protein [Mycobacterium simiae]
MAVKWRGWRHGLDIGIGVRGGVVGRGRFGRDFTVHALRRRRLRRPAVVIARRPSGVRVERRVLAQIMANTRHRIVAVACVGARIVLRGEGIALEVVDMVGPIRTLVETRTAAVP